MTRPEDFRVSTLGPCTVDSPVSPADAEGSGAGATGYFVDDNDRILLEDHISDLRGKQLDELPSLVRAGPRRRIFFDPAKTSVAIVTCGGLCPGLNDVIRGLVMVSRQRYGVNRIYGFRFGYRGLAHNDYLELTPETVHYIHEQGGTLLGSSRGQQDSKVIVDHLAAMQIDILYVIGGDGTMRGALAIAEEVQRRQLPISIVGIPKTIDNDIQFTDRSFGFETAYSTAMHAIRGAHNEAYGAVNGVGLVKLMGRHSGFIACHAALAISHVNFVLIPEVPFPLEGDRGFLRALEKRLDRRGHAVIVVAEGAGQDLMRNTGAQRDASGNLKLLDVGPFLAERIRAHFRDLGKEINLKYIDPSYIIRSIPASPADSVYCWRLAQHAVHAAMCGKTKMVVTSWHGRLVYVPMMQAIAARKQVDPQGDLWLSVLESTGQPCFAPLLPNCSREKPFHHVEPGREKSGGEE